MKHLLSRNPGFTLAGVLALIGGPAKADTFGSGANAFTINFVNIGNAGNADDIFLPNNEGDGGRAHGGVAYTFRMGVTEAAQDWITKATNLGLTHVTAGAWSGNQPAANISWFEAAAFVNWLNTSTGRPAPYNVSWTGSDWTMNLWTSAQAWQAGGENLYRHKDAYYFLPSEDEWYKAAYHKNDGVTANYWDYATGSNTAPTSVISGTAPGTAVYGFPIGTPPAAVDNNGGLSPYGTRGQNGNVYEIQESAADGTNNLFDEERVFQGGYATGDDIALRSSDQESNSPWSFNDNKGFRVASVPEPSCAMLLLGWGWCFLARRRRPVL